MLKGCFIWCFVCGHQYTTDNTQWPGLDCITRVINKIFFDGFSIIDFILSVTTEMFPFLRAKFVRMLSIQQPGCFYDVWMVEEFGGDGWILQRVG